MDRKFVEALNTMRRKVRQSGRQFRQENDNSESLFHPRAGFQFAYDIATVEGALNEFEITIGSKSETDAPLMPRDALMKEASMLAQLHPSKDTRDFANSVIQLLMELETPPTAKVFQLSPTQEPFN